MRNSSISAVDSISVTVDVISVGDGGGVDASWLLVEVCWILGVLNKMVVLRGLSWWLLWCVWHWWYYLFNMVVKRALVFF